MSRRFSEDIISRLRASGWKEERLVSDQFMLECKKIHESLNLSFVDPAREFLCQFGNLDLRFPNRRLIKHYLAASEAPVDPESEVMLCTLSFNPVDAGRNLGKAVPKYCARHNLQMSIVGWMPDEATLIMVASNGRGYMGSGSWFARIADTIDGVITSTIQCEDPLEVLAW